MPCLIFDAACFDVGDVKDEAEYCQVFSQVVLVTQVTTTSYNMDKFYNKDTVNDLVSPAPAEKYYYFCVAIGGDFTGDDMGLHCKLESGTGSIITVDGFVLSQEEYVDLINDEKKQLPNDKLSFGSASVNLTDSTQWSSFLLKGIGKVTMGSYLVLRFNEVASGKANLKFLVTAPVIRVNQRGE